MKTVLAQWAETALDPDTLLVSDGLACFVDAADLVSAHERVVVGQRRSSELECFHWVNTLLGNIKSPIQGTYHGFKFKKYANRYLAEFQYRFNRRFDLPSMVKRLLHVCTLTTARPEKWLRSAEAWGLITYFFDRTISERHISKGRIAIFKHTNTWTATTFVLS